MSAANGRAPTPSRTSHRDTTAEHAARLELHGHRMSVPDEPLLGRARALSRVEHLLAGHRVVTITGAPGVGKTRVALEVAARQAARHKGGVWIVDLFEAGDEESVQWATAGALQLPDLPGRSTVDAVVAGIGTREMLIVLDCCDSARTEVSALVRRVLANCPAAKVLATCSRKLRLDGEGVCGLHPVAARGHERGAYELASSKYKSLSTNERALLRRLAVFPGGCALGQAEAVCSGGGLGPEEVFECLARLVSCSVVSADTGDPEARYRLPSAVHQLAMEKLNERRELEDTHLRQAWWSVTLAEHAEAQLAGVNQRPWMLRLDAEAANFRAALRWLLADEEPNEPSRALRAAHAMRLAGALFPWWRERGALNEGTAWLRRALSLGEDAPPPVRAKALWALGMLNCASDPSVALPLLEESLAIGRGIENDVVCGRALFGVGTCISHDDPDAGLRVLREAVALAGEARDWWCVAQGLAETGRVHLRGNHLSKARASFEDSVATARQTHDLGTLSASLIQLGRVLRVTGDTWSAGSILEEAIRVATAVGRDADVAAATGELGILALESGDSTTAGRKFNEATGFAGLCGAHLEMARAMEGLATVAMAKSSWRSAMSFLANSESELELVRQTPTSILSLKAQVAAMRGQPTQAAGLAKEAQAAARASGDERALAKALLIIGNLKRSDGSLDAAAAAYRDALSLYERASDFRGVLDGLEATAGLAAERGRHFHAARLLGAAAAARDSHCQRRVDADVPNYRSDVELLTEKLLLEDLETAWLEGASMSIDEAIALSRRPPNDTSGTDGWERLTKAERSVVALVALGLTNRQIGERLSISRHTVQTHLAHVFAKLGMSSRTVLAREATTRQQARRRPGAGRPVGLP